MKGTDYLELYNLGNDVLYCISNQKRTSFDISILYPAVIEVDPILDL